MQVIAVDKFIEAVRKRPALWDWRSEEYKDREMKKEGWLEVCLLMCPKFADKSNLERAQIGKDMQLKWKNLRDAYVRHIRTQMDKSRRSKPIRAYIYHTQLAFLRRVINPKVRSKRGLSATSSGDCIKEEDEDELTQQDLLDMVEHEGKRSGPESPDMEVEEEEEDKQEEAVANVDPLLPAAPDNEVRDNDDMNFFKSLLPTLQTLRTEQKLKFRIDVMELLMTYHQAATE